MPKRTKPSAVARTKPKTRAPRAARAAQPGQEHEEKTEMVVEGDEFEHPSQNHQEEEAPNDISLPLDMIHVISSFSDLKTLSKYVYGTLYSFRCHRRSLWFVSPLKHARIELKCPQFASFCIQYLLYSVSDIWSPLQGQKFSFSASASFFLFSLACLTNASNMAETLFFVVSHLHVGSLP